MQDASRAGAAESGTSVQDSVNSVGGDTAIARAVSALLTGDELRALAMELRILVQYVGEATNLPHERAAMSALRKLLTPQPDDCAGCYTERARIVEWLHGRMLDETPTNADPSPLAMMRDAGYRAGWNDLARALVKELQS